MDGSGQMRAVVIMRRVPYYQLFEVTLKDIVERFAIKPLDGFDDDHADAVCEFIRENRFNQELIDFVQDRSQTRCGVPDWLKVEEVPVDREFVIILRYLGDFADDYLALEEEVLIHIPTDNIVDTETLAKFMGAKSNQAICEYLSRCGANVPAVKPEPSIPVEWHKPEELSD